MCTTTPEFPTFLESFLHRYKTEFGFVLQNRDVLVDDVRVRGIGKTQFEDEHETAKDKPEPTESPRQVETVNVFFDDQYLQTDVFKMEDLLPGKFIISVTLPLAHLRYRQLIDEKYQMKVVLGLYQS
jgi:N-methylhydantoinase A/oxoprolinase/acetone carboxylase beta subunit